MSKTVKGLLLGFLILTFTSCGTIMERREKLVTINTNVDSPVKLYLNGMSVGAQKQIYVQSTGWSKDRLMAEDTKTGERLMIPLDYTFNGWFIGSIFLPFGVLVDLISGSVTKLDHTNYYVNFDENTTIEAPEKESESKTTDSKRINK